MQHRRSKNQAIVVDSDFPGGNIIVDSIDGTDIRVHQDLRDTQGHWFYWYFRTRGLAGRSIECTFTQGDVMGVRGPAVSTDGGNTWSWLGAEATTATSFRYTAAPDTDEVRFCFAMPYLEADLHTFLRRYHGDPHLEIAPLCTTRHGRKVEAIRLGQLDGGCQHRILLTCRHHACESTASFSLEGLMDAALADTEPGRWLRDNVEFLIVPFMDKDGVEEGDQGKNRKPYDHNRDYGGDSIYASVRALRERVPGWAEGCLRFALDMHCPWIRGKHNEDIYFVGGPDLTQWEQVGRLSRILEAVQTGPLVFDSKHNLPFGQAWNVGTEELKSCSIWSAALPNVLAGTTIEIPYANASGKQVTTESARAFGRDLAHALHHFLKLLPE